MTKICATALFVLWVGALAVKTLPHDAVAAAEPAPPSFDAAPAEPQDWLADASRPEDSRVWAAHSAPHGPLVSP